MSPSSAPIILATGGTGGHMFPAQALAHVLMERGYRLVLITDSRGDSYGGMLGGLERHKIRAAGISGRGLLARVGAVFLLGLGLIQARRLLKKLKPSVAIGFGGYPAIPTMIAAAQLRIKTVIHEQNAVLGRANRVLAPRADRIATGFPTLARLRDADRDRAVLTGNPVRPEIIAMGGRPYTAPKPDGPVNLLVVGGSQGAAIFSEIVPAALASLPQASRKRLNVVQQCPGDTANGVRAVYEAAGIVAELAPFFKDIPERLSAAHLLICRAGASTIAELTAVGRPAILVPYPHAIDDHQRENGGRLCDAGGGWMMPQNSLTPARLAERVNTLLEQPKKLESAARHASRAGVPDAAVKLADLVCGLIGDTAPGRADMPKEASA